MVHQQNGGVSVARLTGIDHATGEYSIHADPDDWVEPVMIEELISKAKANKADMVICDFYRESQKGHMYESQNPGDDISANAILHMFLSRHLHGFCWNKLVRRTCYSGIGFFPSDLCIWEDELFNIKILSKDIRIAYVPKALYHYRVDNGDLLCHAVTDKSFSHKVKSVKCIEEFCMEKVSGLTKEDFLPIKKRVLFDAFRTKRWDQLSTLYPEEKDLMIQQGTPYRIHFPVSSCIAIALKGHPYLAWTIYRCNMWIINTAQTIKGKLLDKH